MKNLSSLALLLLGSLLTFFSTSELAYAQSTSLDIKRVMNCVPKFFPPHAIGPPFCYETQDEFWPWDRFGVPAHTQLETYLGVYNGPAPQATRNIVFVAPGQRFGNKEGNLVTGQTYFHPYALYQGSRREVLSDQSIPYRLFSQGIFSRADTFAAVAFDARYNWEFDPGLKDQIANAYYTWLKSHVADLSKLEAVYLVGHSRGGALALRLAQMFKKEFGNSRTIVIVDTFDPVARMQTGELGTRNEKIDNPWLVDASYWSWRSDLHSIFPDKRNLSIQNQVNGGKVFGLALDVRSLAHVPSRLLQIEIERNFQSDIGWYSQVWSVDGHENIATSSDAINNALDHVADRLDMFRRNIAPKATVTASSTWPGFNLASVNDTNLDSREVGAFSWVNQNPPAGSSEWLQLTWPARIWTNRIEIISTEGKAPEGFTLQRLHNGVWSDITGIEFSSTKDRETVITAAFDSIGADALRLTNLRGPANEPQFFRVNEILVRGMPDTNLAPLAAASASSTFAGYSPAHANDGNQSTQLGAAYSWVNGGNGWPNGGNDPTPVFQLTWQRPVRTSMLEVFSSNGYALQGYDIQYLSAATRTWLPVTSRIASRLDTYSVSSFDPVVTTAIRLVNFIGPANQPYYYRINELAVHGTFADVPLQPVTLPPGVDPSPPELPSIPMPVKPLPTIGIPVMAY